MSEYPYCDFSPLARVRLHQSVSLSRDFKELETRRPFIVHAALLDRTLGGFVYNNVFAASASLCFADAELHISFPNDQPFLSHIVAMNPHVTRVWDTGDDEAIRLLDFNCTSTRSETPILPDWEVSGALEADLILTPWMMETPTIPSFPNRARLRTPDHCHDVLERRLTDAGVAKDGWFCTLHYREPSYGARASQALRELDPHDAAEIVRHVVQEHGGQVVRVGHPGMTPLPAIDGFVDLSGVEDAFPLQAHAISRSRGLLQLSDSGPMAIAQAVGTPMLLCNAISPGFVFDESSISLFQHVLTGDGTRIPVATALRNGLYNRRVLERVLHAKGYRFAPNGLAEIRAAVDAILEATRDCQGWRATPPPVFESYPEHMAWPPATETPVRYLEFPELIDHAEAL